MNICRRCGVDVPKPRRGATAKRCRACTAVVNRDTVIAWRRAHGIQPTKLPASHQFTGRTRKPRQRCACGVENPRASTSNGQPYRCRACYGLAQRVYRTPERPCAHCGILFRAVVSGRKCCSDACSAARVEEARDRTRIPVAKLLARQRARRRRASAKRRAHFKRAGASTKPQVGRWRRICERDGWVCWICKGRIDPSMVPSRHRRAPSVDHVILLSRGGRDDDANVRAAHYGCNSRRKA